MAMSQTHRDRASTGSEDRGSGSPESRWQGASTLPLREPARLAHASGTEGPSAAEGPWCGAGARSARMARPEHGHTRTLDFGNVGGCWGATLGFTFRMSESHPPSKGLVYRRCFHGRQFDPLSCCGSHGTCAS